MSSSEANCSASAEIVGTTNMNANPSMSYCKRSKLKIRSNHYQQLLGPNELPRRGSSENQIDSQNQRTGGRSQISSAINNNENNSNDLSSEQSLGENLNSMLPSSQRLTEGHANSRESQPPAATTTSLTSPNCPEKPTRVQPNVRRAAQLETRAPMDYGPMMKQRGTSLAASWWLTVALALTVALLVDWRPAEPKVGASSQRDWDWDWDIYKALEVVFGAKFAGVRARGVILAEAQYRPDWPSKALQQEIFLLNLEDGYFGCQVNESQDFLQLFELSRLCDGQSQCYLGTDEMVSPLKCNNRERCGTYVNSRGQQEIIQCVNGVCLDGLCYCNDGFGGKACDIPDENECKYRPCDVFAHCTNTMGSYYCSCFPGYDGDGMHCQDINECEIPSLAALCSDNSECCNLPGHFVCKCKPGYQQAGQSQSSLTGAPSGNTTVQCTDIDECQDERACGKGAVCENLPGSYRCSCPPGFTGDPALECIDMDECRNNPCGAGAQCTNVPGGYRCACAPGFERNPTYPADLLGSIQTSTPGSVDGPLAGNATVVACLDVNECANKTPVCGTGAQCINTPGAYFCQCPPNYTGNPKLACVDIDECASQACGPNAQCKNLPGGFKCECKPGYSGNAYSTDGCQDEDECLRKDACGLNAQCFNTPGSFQCTCLSGYTGDAFTKCADIDECSNGANPCGPGAQCHNLAGGYKCTCPDKYLARGTPEMGCERAAVDIGCSADYDCTQNALCVNSTCQCKFGYQISGIDCVDVDECILDQPRGQPQAPLAPIKAFTRLNLASSAAASAAPQPNNASLASSLAICGLEASCLNTDGSYKCDCKPGYEKIDSRSPTSKCRDVNECDISNPCGQNSKCFNTDGSYKCACNDGFIPIDSDPANGCKSPCDGVNCGQHATCKPHGEEAACVCKPGFTFDPNNIKLGCVDINECDTNYGAAGLCGQRAICTNVPGSYRCHCPSGYSGDAYRYCEDVNECDRKFGTFGQCGESAICNNTAGSYTCACAPGYSGDPRTKCSDIDECSTKFGANGKCGLNAICTNTPGRFTCRCPDDHSGDPYEKCVPELPACSAAADCAQNFVCQAGRCHCPFPQAGAPTSECHHPCEKTECGAHATCQLDADNQPLCVCASGYMAPSDGRSGCVDVNECIQGITLSGITPLAAITSGQGSVASAAANGTSVPCGRNALCRNHPGSFDCVCPPGHSGNPYEACVLDVRSQQMTTTTTSTATTTTTAANSMSSTSGAQSSNTNGPFGNYQQEPRVSSCSETCPRGQLCLDGQCVKPDSCRDNQDCRATMACEHVNSHAGFQCVNVCELNPCGPEARCTPLNHKPICSCNASAGYAGDPYDLINGCKLQTSFQVSQLQTSTTSSQFGQHSSGFSSSSSSQKERLNNQGKNTVSSHQEGDLSTVSLGGSFGADGGLTVATIGPGLATTSLSGLFNATNTILNQHSQQNFDLSEGKRPNQPLFAYELPLPTTPISPQLDTQLNNQLAQSVYATGKGDQQQARQNYSSVGEDFKQTTTNPGQLQTTTATTFGQQTGAKSSQQQTSTTQNLFANKKRPTVSPSLAGQQQQSNTNTMISQDSQTSSNNRQDNLQETLQKQQQQYDELQNQLAQNQQQEANADIMQTFSQFSNKSAASQSIASNRFSFVHQQVACTSDQHCPGNLFCLASDPLLSAQPSKSSQKVCGCPAGYKREADYCYMHRVNCTSPSVCKNHEECISSAILQQYYSSSPLQQQQGSQQFALGEPVDELVSGVCVCPRGYRLTANGIACIDRNECDEGTPCAVGAICQNKIGSYECVCPQGTIGDPYTKTCEPIVKFECQSSSDCALDRECDLNARKCVSPCHKCGPRAICTATNHVAICLCPPRYTGNAIDLVYGCQEPPAATTTTTTSTSTATPTTTTTSSSTTTRPPATTTSVGVPVTTLLPSTTTVAPLETTTPELVEFRTIPPSELFVMCLADGIQVEVQLGGFDGIIYVKGHSQDPKCRKLVMSSNANEFVDFKVQFGHCDLIHRDGEAGFVLVIQKHPKLVTYRARAYHVKCVYNTGERTVTLGFNVSMITTSGTIANTGPPPTCLMSITALDGREVTSAEIGQDLLLRVDVQPDSIYGGFARSCEAKTMDDEGEYRYEVTDANGCATDPSIFSDWKYDQHRKSLVARFNAFKFPSSNNLRFQCNIRVCFGSCPAVNCNGIDAYGKRRRRRQAPTIGNPDGFNATAAEDEDDSTPADELIVTDAFKEGALREEIMVQSNAILTFDKKEASLPQQRPQVEDIEFVCLPRLGMAMSIALTTLLALLALAIATSCWCVSKRKRQNMRSNGGPLPHPSNFPNPLLRSSSVSTLRESIYGP